MFDFICYDSELFETEFEICGNFYDVLWVARLTENGYIFMNDVESGRVF